MQKIKLLYIRIINTELYLGDTTDLKPATEVI